MNDSSALLITRLKSYLDDAPHGAIGEFCVKSGISRQSLKNWLSGTAIPLSAIDGIAKGLDLQPWELLKPAETQLQEKGPKLVETSKSALIGDIVTRLARFDEDQLGKVLTTVKAFDEIGPAGQVKKLSKGNQSL